MHQIPEHTCLYIDHMLHIINNLPSSKFVSDLFKNYFRQIDVYYYLEVIVLFT